MKYKFLLLTLLFVLNSCGESSNIAQNDKLSEGKEVAKVYEIIQEKNYATTGDTDSTGIPGFIDSLTISKLNEPLKAMAAFYSAMGGSMCSSEYCDLTTALGLGKQGSEQHKSLITAYFPEDKVAATVVEQDCYLRPSGASTFSDYAFLRITDAGDTIRVDYNLMYYNRGDVQWIKGPDVYVYSNNEFRKVQRNLWTYVEE